MAASPLSRIVASAAERIDRSSGQVFNLGGGPENTLSLLELVGQLDRLTGRPLAPGFADWRPGGRVVSHTR